MPSSRWILVAALPLAAASAASGTACSGVSAHANATGTGAGGVAAMTTGATSASAGAGGAPSDAGTDAPLGNPGRALFDAFEAELLSECSGCHKLGGIADRPFLAGPDVYASLTAWPGIIVSDAPASILLTHPADPSHGGGQAPNLTKDLQAKVLAWLTYEGAHLPMSDAGASLALPIIKPIFNGAVNVMYLDTLGTLFAGSSITFTAQQLGTPPAILDITDIQVHPTAGILLHIVHPLFTVYPVAGGVLPDSIDSFAGLDDSYLISGDANGSQALGVGSIILTDWAGDARLGIAFENIEVLPGPEGLPCKDVATFLKDVVPQMKYCAATCHDGTNAAAPPKAKQAMDLSGLKDVPPSAACMQVRPRVNPTAPDQSQIFLNTDPLGAAIHMYKFKGDEGAWKAFKSNVTPWIMVEK